MTDQLSDRILLCALLHSAAAIVWRIIKAGARKLTKHYYSGPLRVFIFFRPGNGRHFD